MTPPVSIGLVGVGFARQVHAPAFRADPRCRLVAVSARDAGRAQEAANALAIETFVGAAQLAAQSNEDVAVLRARVTSKGGTTEAALASMARDRVRESIARAVNAAQQRSRELGDEFGKQ